MSQQPSIQEPPASADAATELRRRIDAIPASPALRLVPIRHHSPTCAHHLETLIRRDRPQRILIEGPSDANALVPFLGSKDCRPPVAIYAYCVDKSARWAAQILAAEPLRYRSFYPLAAFSPELVALRTGVAIGARVEFIDLPYAGMLAASAGRPGDLEARESSLLGDQALSSADATARMVALSGCRDFNEWWDRYFESGAMELEPEAYFRNLLGWCLMLRDGSPGLADAETQTREQHMAEMLRQASSNGESCLVVTGGAHTEAIARRLQQSAQPLPVHPTDEQGVYLIPYSLDRLDRANHYAAGMPHCGYYQKVWEKRRRNRRAIQQAHRQAGEELTLALGRELRRAGENVTLPDIMEALVMSHRLGQLRAVPPGRPELVDSLLSCFVKEALDSPSHRLPALLDTVLAGQGVGRLPKGYPAAPLVADFRRECRELRLPLSPTSSRDRILSLFRSAQHRRTSRILHRLRFLGIPYGDYLFGPDVSTGKDLERVREGWHLRWRPETEALLTEKMHYGSNLREAALSLLNQRLDQSLSGTGPQNPDQEGYPEAVSLLLEGLRMGLHPMLGRTLDGVRQWLQTENAFPELVRGARGLDLTLATGDLLQTKGLPGLEDLVGDAFARACLRLGWLGEMDPSMAESHCAALLELNALAVPGHPWVDMALYARMLEQLADSGPPRLLGAAAGLLGTRSIWSRERSAESLHQALAQAFADADYLGEFLLGFMPAAHGLFVHSPELIAAVGEVLLGWNEDVLLSVLPRLRLAFTALKPSETEALARAIDAQLQSPEAERTTAIRWTRSDLARLGRLRRATEQGLAVWGMQLTARGDRGSSYVRQRGK